MPETSAEIINKKGLIAASRAKNFFANLWNANLIRKHYEKIEGNFCERSFKWKLNFEEKKLGPLECKLQLDSFQLTLEAFVLTADENGSV